MAFLKLISFFFIFNVNAASLSISDGEQTLYEYGASDLSAQEVRTYNQNRKFQKTYLAVPTEDILNKAFPKGWKNKKKIVFVALDKYKVMYTMKKFLKVNSKYQAFISHSEKGKSGFTPILKKGKSKDTGPFLLIWGGVEKKTPVDKVKFKYPYQLKEIRVTAK